MERPTGFLDTSFGSATALSSSFSASDFVSFPASSAPHAPSEYHPEKDDFTAATADAFDCSQHERSLVDFMPIIAQGDLFLMDSIFCTSIGQGVCRIGCLAAWRKHIAAAADEECARLPSTSFYDFVQSVFALHYEQHLLQFEREGSYTFVAMRSGERLSLVEYCGRTEPQVPDALWCIFLKRLSPALYKALKNSAAWRQHFTRVAPWRDMIFIEPQAANEEGNVLTFPCKTSSPSQTMRMLAQASLPQEELTLYADFVHLEGEIDAQDLQPAISLEENFTRAFEKKLGISFFFLEKARGPQSLDLLLCSENKVFARARVSNAAQKGRAKADMMEKILALLLGRSAAKKLRRPVPQPLARFPGPPLTVVSVTPIFTPAPLKMRSQRTLNVQIGSVLAKSALSSFRSIAPPSFFTVAEKRKSTQNGITPPAILSQSSLWDPPRKEKTPKRTPLVEILDESASIKIIEKATPTFHSNFSDPEEPLRRELKTSKKTIKATVFEPSIAPMRDLLSLLNSDESVAIQEPKKKTKKPMHIHFSFDADKKSAVERPPRSMVDDRPIKKKKIIFGDRSVSASSIPCTPQNLAMFATYLRKTAKEDANSLFKIIAREEYSQFLTFDAILAFKSSPLLFKEFSSIAKTFLAKFLEYNTTAFTIIKVKKGSIYTIRVEMESPKSRMIFEDEDFNIASTENRLWLLKILSGQPGFKDLASCFPANLSSFDVSLYRADPFVGDISISRPLASKTHIIALKAFTRLFK